MFARFDPNFHPLTDFPKHAEKVALLVVSLHYKQAKSIYLSNNLQLVMLAAMQIDSAIPHMIGRYHVYAHFGRKVTKTLSAALRFLIHRLNCASYRSLLTSGKID